MGADMLIDLRGHMAGHRLLTFALRPAPLQMSYLGYQYTCGFDAIDYRICDHGTDPPGLTEKFHVEKLLRLERTIWCYGPQEQVQRASVPPLERNGYFTFGVFQKPAKINGFIVELWCRILLQVPRSRLMILCPSFESAEGLKEVFGRRGVDPERIVPVLQGNRIEYLQLHNQVDLVLDTFPYAGVTTTCDALWMGVPVLTLLGPEPFERAGASLLPVCGLSQCVQDRPDRLLRCAMAIDRTNLLHSPEEFARRFEESELMNACRLARSVEVCFRSAWARAVLKLRL